MTEADSYRAETARLFEGWEARRGSIGMSEVRTVTIDHSAGSFIRDGVVCPDEWFSSGVRPLYLLKEAYGDGGWDLGADHLLTEGTIKKSRMWRRVSEWTYGIIHTTAEGSPAYSSLPVFDRYGNEYLRKIAVVNIKKSHGAPDSDMQEILAYAEFDREYLRRQFELCAPTVIICGYTASALDIIMDVKMREPRNREQFYHITLNGRQVLALDYWHPANQYPAIMNYYGLMGIYRESLKEQSGHAEY